MFPLGQKGIQEQKNEIQRFSLAKQKIITPIAAKVRNFLPLWTGQWGWLLTYIPKGHGILPIAWESASQRSKARE